MGETAQLCNNTPGSVWPHTRLYFLRLSGFWKVGLLVILAKRVRSLERAGCPGCLRLQE